MSVLVKRLGVVARQTPKTTSRFTKNVFAFSRFKRGLGSRTQQDEFMAGVKASLPGAEPQMFPFTGPKAWTNSTLDEKEVFQTLSDKAKKELVEYTRATFKPGQTDIHNVVVSPSELPETKKEADRLAKTVKEGAGLVVLRPIEGLNTTVDLRFASVAFSAMFGPLLTQDSKGTKALLMYDWGEDMIDGRRFHQTNEGARTGGSIHSDHVNQPAAWDFRLEACLRPARIGGQAIAASAASVHNLLLKLAPEAVEPLCQPFWWEYRGFDRNMFYRAPVFSYTNGQPYIRYLRPYLESAHKRIGEPLSDRQSWALDALNATLETRELQFRYRLEPGEMLLSYMPQMLHGRTTFIDDLKASEDDTANEVGVPPYKRVMQRTWMKSAPN